MRGRVALVVAVVFGLMAPFVVAAPSALADDTITVSLSPRSVTYGDAQKASGSVSAAAPCNGGRIVDLQQKRAGSSAWTVLSSTTSANDGSFQFSLSPQTNASYRAVAEAALTCGELDSAPVSGRVLALVGLQLGRDTVPAGECVKATISVRPDKPGQDVRLQQQEGSRWTTVATRPLDASSQASTQRCFGWSSLGTPSLRAVWPAQDTLNAAGTSRTLPVRVVRAAWMKKIDQLTSGRTVGVSVRSAGHVLYARADEAPFVPASNEKLLLSMALLDRLGPGFVVDTDVAAATLHQGVVKGNLWIVGHGDPSTGAGAYAALARAVAQAGVRKVTGRVMGSTAYFARDWFARGWKPEFPAEEVGLPSALTFKENHVDGRNVPDPERYAAQALTRRLKAVGVKVAGAPGSGIPARNLQEIVTHHSPALVGLLRHMDRDSDNFYAEVLGKRFGVATSGTPGTIRKGAAAVESWVRAHGASAVVNDGSGLSYANRVSPAAVTTLLQAADASSWGAILRGILPRGGQGTLDDRLSSVNVHAKTGTLTDISALSGWVWLSRTGAWAQFSILDRGMCSCRSKPMEDAIVKTIARYAR